MSITKVSREIRCLAAVLSNDYPYTYDELVSELKRRYNVKIKRAIVKQLVGQISVMIRDGQTLASISDGAA